LEAAFVLLEFSSPSRRIFIGSHSLPPLWFAVSVLQRPILTMSRPRSKTRRTEDPGQDPHWQEVESPASWLHLRPVPYKRDPHDESPPHTRSLCLTREVSVSHEKSPPCTTTLRLRLVHGPWRAARAQDVSTTTDTRGGTIPHAMQVQQLATMQASHPDKSLNAGLIGCATIPSPSTLTLPHASLARGTRVPYMTRTSLDLGSGVAG
jgi:hypothetical protein